MKKVLLITLCFCGTYLSLRAQATISTFAGGYIGDGVAATNAFTDPNGVAIDANGNIYIADRNNHRIRKVDSSTGIITTVAGSGIGGFSGDGAAATSAKLFYPAAVAVDAIGAYLYIADQSNNRIRKVDLNAGVITTVAGSGLSSFSGDGGSATTATLNGPTGISIDGSGNLYIADRYNGRVRKVTQSTGIISTIAGNGASSFSGDGGLATSAALYYPTGIAVDGTGNLYITDYYNHRVRQVIQSTGIISTVAGNGTYGSSGDGGLATSATISYPSGITIDGTGNLYVADRYNSRVRKVTQSTGVISTVAGNASSTFSGDGGAATSASLYYPTAVAVDGSGNLYIADQSNGRIRKVTQSTGIITTVAGRGSSGGDGDIATHANFLTPTKAAFDASGSLYIADQSNQRIRKIESGTGIVSTVAGNGISGFGGDGGAATSANLNYPSDVAFDASGNMYIADMANNRIRKVDVSTGVITTVAGNGAGSFSGDGGIATSAGLNYPIGIAVDGNNNIYIADRNNNRIRKVDSNTGIITTVAGNGSAGFSGDGGAAVSASLDNPFDVAIDANNNFYIADTYNQKIRRVDNSTSVISTAAGNGAGYYSGDGGVATNAGLYYPGGLAIDGNGNLYIADWFNERVRVVSKNTGLISTVAGNGLYSYSGDGGLAANAEMRDPTGVTVDGSGNLFIVENGSNVIRQVIKATPTVTITSSNSGSYGGTINLTTNTGGSTGDVTYSIVNGTGSATVIGSMLTLTGVGTVMVKSNVGYDANYTYGSTTQIVTINKATPTVSITSSSLGVYGDNIPLTTDTGGSTGAVTYTVANGTGSATVTGSTLSLTGAGAVTVTTLVAADANYNPTTAVQIVTISKATPTINITSSNSGTYGDNISLTASTGGSTGAVVYAVVNETGSATLTGSTLALTGAGAVKVKAYVGYDANYNYDSSFQVVTINKASLTAEARTLNKTYGDVNPSLIKYTGFVGNDDATLIDVPPTITTNATTFSDVGAYPVTISGGSDNDYMITVATPNGTLTIDKASLTAEAITATKAYGDPIPALIKYTGFIGGDDASVLDASPIATTSATTMSDAGIYPITVAGGSDNNYTITVATANGALTIDKAPLKVTADNKTKTYGGANPSLTFSYSGFKGNDTGDLIDSAPTVSTTATTNSDAGMYAITTAGGSDNNYSLTYAAGILTIDKANQTITFGAIDDRTMGDAAFMLAATSASGLAVSYAANSPKASVSGSQITIVDAGRVIITASQAGNNNYNAATSVNQSFCIKPPKPTISASFTNEEQPVLTSNSAGGYQWYMDGSLISGANKSTLTVSYPGSYAVQASADDCLSVMSDVKVIVVTGVEADPDMQVSTYPNPASNSFTVRASERLVNELPVDVSILDMLGKEMARGGKEMVNHEINIANYRAGMYLVRVDIGKQTNVVKFIKQ